MDLKQVLGQYVAKFVKDNQIIGVGTGTTVSAAIVEIAKRVKAEKLTVSFVSTSLQTSQQLQEEGLRVLDLSSVGRLDWGFDGADAVDAKRQAIKGKGAAMLREKIMAVRCKEYYLVIDASKKCQDLVAHCVVPVEIVPESLFSVQESLSHLSIEKAELRQAVNKHGPVITEKGNLVIDVKFAKFHAGLEDELKQIVGVVETGLFLKYATKVITLDGQTIVEF